MFLPDDPHLNRGRTPYLLLSGLAAVFAAALIVYSQTIGFAWDEGFHLLAAQLIKHGKRPYLDFFFPQTPLNAYWNAALMTVFGESWRVAHVASSLESMCASLLAADYVFSRFPAKGWRVATAFTVLCLVSFNEGVVQYGSVSQAYGLCLLLLVASFRVSVRAVERDGVLLAGLAGLLAGAAAASSLLTAPAAPVFLIWIILYNRLGSRAWKLTAFVAGILIAFSPVLWLFVQGPRQVFFNIVEFHAFHRQEHWDGALAHDIEVWAAWLGSTQAFILASLAICGLAFVRRRSGWEKPQQAEFYLCGWLTLAISAHLLNAHPTFQRYFLLTVPFLAILAVSGVYGLALRLVDPPRRPLWPALLVIGLAALGVGRSVHSEVGNFNWKDAQKLADKIDQVTPPGGLVLSPEQSYFLRRRVPLPGMEHADSHKLELPPALADRLHVVSDAELIRRVKAGVFSTVQDCDDKEEHVKAFGLAQIFSQSVDIGECTVYWDRR